jgi:hypothetical protein
MRVRSNEELVRRFAPDSAAIYSEQEPETWAAPRSPHDRVEDYALLHPVGADAMTELSSGWVVAGSRLGSVLLRDPAGNWRTVRSDGLESILWVRPYERGNVVLIAVGELTTMLKMERSARDMRLTRIDPGNLPPGNLLFIDGNDSVGWFVVHQFGGRQPSARSSTDSQGRSPASNSMSITR